MKILEKLFFTFVGVFGPAFAVAIFLPFGLALAQEGEPAGGAAATLQQCVDFFVQGGPVDWVLGGVFLLATILGLFFRTSVLGIIKDVVGKILGAAKR